MADRIKIVSDKNLEYYKSKEDAYNDSIFARKTAIPANTSQLTNDSGFVDSAYVTSAINDAIDSTFTWKGTVETVENLPSTAEVGDVYHVNENGGEYAWNGTAWEALGNTSGVSMDWNAIEGKPSTFPPSAHTHTVANITDFPESMPASDVAAWAKQPNKPSYTASEVGAAATNHTHANMGGATSSAGGSAGFVPAPAAGKQSSFLRGDGQWVVPANTTYENATSSTDGLMSSEDKTRFDAMPDVEAMTTTEIDALFT